MTDSADANASPPKGTAAIERDIERTRADLAGTVQSLADKFDVKAQARRRADRLKAAGAARYEQARATYRERPAMVAACGGAVVVALVGAVLLARRNR